MESIASIQKEIVAEFGLFDDWTDKYEYIIDLGKKNPGLPESSRVPENLIKGCQSQVWLTASMDNSGNLIFKGDSDAVIVKGLVALLIRVLSGHKPEEVAGAELFFIDEIGMTSHLAQTRSNGLLSMVKQMKFYALAFRSRESTENPIPPAKL
jgi:cysteine desulfuration protein SufE